MRLLAHLFHILGRLPLIGRFMPRHWRKIRIKHLLWGALAIYLLWTMWIFIHIVCWRWVNPDMTSFMNEQLTRLQDDDPNAELKYQWVPYAKISRHIKRALLVAEDAKFADHDGFDWEGMQYAWEKNLKKGRIVAGGSTISQQLAKNLFLSSSRTPWRKLEEALITVMLEAVLDKQRIFEIYLNVIEWGNGLFGVEAAARKYYHVHASQLAPAQAAKLAAMVTNPRYYQLHLTDRRLLRKASIIQQRMAQADLPQPGD